MRVNKKVEWLNSLAKYQQLINFVCSSYTKNYMLPVVSVVLQSCTTAYWLICLYFGLDCESESARTMKLQCLPSHLHSFGFSYLASIHSRQQLYPLGIMMTTSYNYFVLDFKTVIPWKVHHRSWIKQLTMSNP